MAPKDLCRTDTSKVERIAMAATIEAASLTTDEMIDELMSKGTVAGFTSLEEMRTANFGMDIFAKSEGITGEGRLRKLGGIAASRNLTFTQLCEELHAELIARLRRALVERTKAGKLGGHPSPIFSEIVNS